MQKKKRVMMTQKKSSMGFTMVSYREFGKICALLNCNSHEEEKAILASYKYLEENKEDEILTEEDIKKAEEIINNFYVNMEAVQRGE